jgi:hypothetical protein
MAAQPKRRAGRPPKGAHPTTKMVSVRLSDDDLALLAALQAHEQAAADKVGVTLSQGDVLRLALRLAAKRRGIAPAA